ncbi:response regulator transcription factor [Sutterella sp.]|uniref:response regulator transcription factor n=1 Tax=Sutterella sp. TaxID=1981025 RepID=UPI0026E0ED58|nr:response regulator [Sutterella sp.]MDO5531547.1 response regulator [Sutterella sp.]
MTREERPLIRIVDDDPAMRSAYALMLSAEGWETAEYEDAHAFLTGDAPSRPGCVLMDYQMPGMNGLDLVREMHSRGIKLPVIFLTAHADVDLAVQTMKDGALDFLTKPADEERLLTAIGAAVERDLRAHAGIREPAVERALFDELTERELGVVRLVARGLLNREIGEALGIAEKTVQAYRAAAYRRLGVKSAAELTELLIRIGERT